MNIGTLYLDNNIFLAPMAGISDLPYRLIMKRFGAGLVFTEMVSANGLFFNGAATRELLKSVPEERPLGVQLFGEDPQRLGKAARMVEAGADLIDINLGCPVRKVVRAGAGSALLNDPLRVGEIVRAVRRATTLPVTVKMRSGWDASRLNFLEIARIAETEGADAVTLHPRTRSQGFAGQAQLEHLRQLKEAMRIPVIGSGDLFTADDIKTMFTRTGCDAVMIGRGGYGNPWLIQQALDVMAGRTSDQADTAERGRIAREHLELYIEYFGPRKALGHMRKHLCWYVRGLPNSAGFRSRMNNIASVDDMRGILDDFFVQAA